MLAPSQLPGNGWITDMIDPRVEEQVRECFRAVIARDAARLHAALTAVGRRDRPTALRYGRYVCARVVDDIFPAGATPDQLTALARRIVEVEAAWYPMPAPDRVAALLATRPGEPGAAGRLGIDQPPAAPGVVFCCAAHLLSRYRAHGQRAYEYLDDIWNTHPAGLR